MRILNEDLIILDIQGTTPEGAVQNLLNILEEKEIVTEGYAPALFREFETSVNSFVFGQMVAVAKTNAFSHVKENAVVLIRLEHSINFSKTYNQPVRLLFGAVSTNHETEMYLHSLIVRLIHDNTLLSALLTEAQPKSLSELIQHHLNKR